MEPVLRSNRLSLCSTILRFLSVSERVCPVLGFRSLIFFSRLHPSDMKTAACKGALLARQHLGKLRAWLFRCSTRTLAGLVSGSDYRSTLPTLLGCGEDESR